ncbi:hypothetical protein EWT58_01280 [Escherichia coli O25b:H4]|nr:hypothetical protein EWT58_01280 [Escherichia coli O25b:H4]
MLFCEYDSILLVVLRKTLIFTINKFKTTHTKYFCIYGYRKRFRSSIRHILYLVLVKCRF